MRKTIILTAFALASCGSNAPTNTAAVSDESDSAEVTAVNDTTAIDAATGEAANMAADVNYSLNEESADENAGNSSSDAPANTSAR